MKAQAIAVTTGWSLFGVGSLKTNWTIPARFEFPVGRFFLFAALSLADLILTYVLLQNTGGLVYESNPLANAFLSQYGWAGMAIFKVADVLVVAWICVVLALFQPRAARRVLTAACVIVGCVAVYSTYLVAQYV